MANTGFWTHGFPQATVRICLADDGVQHSVGDLNRRFVRMAFRHERLESENRIIAHAANPFPVGKNGSRIGLVTVAGCNLEAVAQADIEAIAWQQIRLRGPQ